MNNQKGLTLVELLVSIVIFSIVLLFATSLLMNAMKTQKKVNADIVLRDEADFIMSNLIREIYTTKESEVKFIEEPSKNNYYLHNIDDPSIVTGFKDNQILVKGSTLNTRVNILWDKSEISVSENTHLDRTYNITLTIESDNAVEKTFKSEVRSINDKINDDEDEEG